MKTNIAVAVGFTSAAVLAAAGVGLAVGPNTVAGEATGPQISALESANKACGSPAELDDGGATLLVDAEGEESNSGTVTNDDVGCLLVQLDVPAWVTARMGSTRALDGMQDAAWDGYSASWTYHPDAGLNLTITENG